MKRYGFALLSGGLFGAGLRVSGMTDTQKVQNWLDVSGSWDPTLTFVMAGAILPMAVAWRVVATRDRSYLGAALPAPARREIDRDLILGAILFGMGWALAGLCPGPALASLGFGGGGGMVFLLAMLGGMVAAPAVRKWLAALPASARSKAARVQAARPRSKMDIRALTPTYAVSPQIDLADLAAIKAAGFTTVIDNRPDGEIPPHLQTPHMQAEAEALGLTFVANPVIGGALTMENVRLQSKAMAEAAGPVLAYCASGNRCSVVWALVNAGHKPTDELIGTPAKYGYNLEPLRGQIEALAAQGNA